MSTPASPYDPGLGTIPLERPVPQRHALGLPAGSIRALIAFMVLASLWLLALYGGVGEDNRIPIAYVYLQYVMILILAHFFAAHGNTIGRNVSRHNPLWLPSGFVRFFLLVGYLGLVGWLIYSGREFEKLPSASLMLPLVLLTTFLLGYVFHKLVKMFSSPGKIPFWFQDIQAWLALVSMFGLLVIVLLHLFILKNHPKEDLMASSSGSSSGVIETIVAGIIGFYFGARSLSQRSRETMKWALRTYCCPPSGGSGVAPGGALPLPARI